MMEIKALAFDLDGTLLGPSAILTDRTLKSVRAFAQKGLDIILATGRAVESAEKYRIPLEAGGPMVYFNGAVIADMPAGNILDATLLSKEIVKTCVELSAEMGIYFQYFISGTAQRPGQPLLTSADHPRRDMYYKHTGILAEICEPKKALEDPQVQGCIKGMFLAEPEVLDNLRPIIEKQFGSDIYAVRSTSTFLEILNPNVSKGSGLDFALKHRSIKPAETAVFGDEENDLPMFDLAGLSVAPGNARENVKARADIVVRSNAEDGIAEFLENVFL